MCFSLRYREVLRQLSEFFLKMCIDSVSFCKGCSSGSKVFSKKYSVLYDSEMVLEDRLCIQEPARHCFFEI